VSFSACLCSEVVGGCSPKGRALPPSLSSTMGLPRVRLHALSVHPPHGTWRCVLGPSGTAASPASPALRRPQCRALAAATLSPPIMCAGPSNRAICPQQRGHLLPAMGHCSPSSFARTGNPTSSFQLSTQLPDHACVLRSRVTKQSGSEPQKGPP